MISFFVIISAIFMSVTFCIQNITPLGAASQTFEPALPFTLLLTSTENREHREIPRELRNVSFVCSLNVIFWIEGHCPNYG